MTPEQNAAEIIIQAIARVEAMRLVLLTMVACFAIAALFALAWRWANRVERMNFYKARDEEARALVEASVDTINRQANELRRYRNQLLEVDIYFGSHKATFDDRQRDPLVADIKALLGERPSPPQITFQRRRQLEQDMTDERAA